MQTPHKPTDYNSVSPYLIVNGADSTINFLVEVFGATKLRRVANESGKVMHAEIRIDDTVLMLTDAFPPAWPSIPAHVHLFVEDADASYRKAIEAGAASVQVPVKRGDENKRGAVKDAGGTTWWISTKVE
jgi:PhnB protein